MMILSVYFAQKRVLLGCWKLKKKLRWYPQQPQCSISTNLSEACCEAKRWKHLSWLSVNYMAANPVEPDLALHQRLPHILQNLVRNPVEPDRALHQSLPEPSPEPSSEPC